MPARQITDEAIKDEAGAGQVPAPVPRECDFDRLENEYLPFIKWFAWQLLRQVSAQEDLWQEGRLGLLYAIRHYDPARRVKFSTYANDCIKRHMLKWIRDYSRIIKIPAYQQEVARAKIATYPFAVPCGVVTNCPA